jgi:hypothetical protein
MCQFFQKFIILFDLNGELKLTGSLIPKNIDIPIAMSEYPEKSKYN